MLYPYGAPSIARSLSDTIALDFSPDGNLGALISDTCLSIVLLLPVSKISSCTRATKSLRELGVNEAVIWSDESNKVAVSTANGSCIIFQVMTQRLPDVELYQTIHSLKRTAFADYALSQLAVISLGTKIESFCGVGSKFCVADANGYLKQFNWSDGLLVKNQSKPLSTIPFAYDLHPSRASLLRDSVGIVCLRNAIGSMGGLLCVLSDGRAAILASESADIDFNHIQGIFAPNVSDAVWVCHNEKLRQMIITSKSGSMLIFAMNELTNELVLTCKYEIRQKLNISQPGKVFAREATVCLGGLALCAVLNTGIYQFYSIFGSLLWEADPVQFSKSRVQVARLSPSGYQLWICVASRDPLRGDSRSPGGFYSSDRRSVTLVQPVVKSVNSILSSHFSESFILLQGHDRIMLGSNQNFESSDNVKCWKQAVIPLPYLRGAEIVKFSCVDPSGNNVAVASQHGVVLYNFEQLKWKMFGNEIQEKELSVCGGMTWFEEFIVFTCRNNDSSRYELRAYSRLMNLENNSKSAIHLPSKPLVVNMYKNFFTVLDRQSSLVMFKLEIHSTSNNKRTCVLAKIQETPLNMFVPYPQSILSIMFTDVGHQMGNHPIRDSTPRSFLINVAGRLAIFPRDPLIDDLEIPDQVPLCTPTVIASNVESVTLYNSSMDGIPRSPYFNDAVWLMCGASGLKIWLPLPVDAEDSSRSDGSFGFKRSVFIFHPAVYPLAMECNSGFIMGVDSENTVLNSPHSRDIMDVLAASDSKSKTSQAAQPVANYVMSKTMEIFIPQLMEEMLRRNLNSHAVRLMKSIDSLPSFDHILELLLHNVLEAEATASDPIADPLLPSVISVLNQQYRRKFLRILAKCARKTEVAIWSFLFNTAGNPAHYFKRCIEEEDLSTAASYMIILQSLEPLSVSKQYANVLVDTCLEKRHWLLVRDIIRFLKSIAASSGDEVSPKVSHTPYSVYAYPQINSSSNSQVNAPHHSANVPSNSSTGSLNSLGGRTRNTSQSGGQNAVGGVSSSGNPSGGSITSFTPVGGVLTYSQSPKTAVARSVSTDAELNSSGQKSSSGDHSQRMPSTSGSNHQVSGPLSQQQPDSNDIFYLSSLIARRARTLLVGYELRQLFVMASHIGFNLTSWLKRERNRAAKIDSYQDALEKLHVEFDWPFPVLADQSKIAAEHLKSSTLSSSSTTSSVVTLQDFPPASAERIDCAASGASSLSNSESKSNPIAVPSTATWIHSDSHPSLYSSLNAATNRHPGQLSLDLDNMSLENTLGSGFTPNQNALQHARLQLADLSSSLESNNPSSFFLNSQSLNNSPNNNQNDTVDKPDDGECSTWSDDVTATWNTLNESSTHQNAIENSLLIVGSVAETAHTQLAQSADLESLVQQFKNKGSERSKRLLTHALGVMVESECYEWAILICLMLSDVTQAISIINNIISSSQLTDVGQRLIQGLTSLDSWAAQHCFTYRLFLAALFPYVQVLKTVMDFSFKTQKTKKLSLNNSAPLKTGGLLMTAGSETDSKHTSPNKEASIANGDSIASPSAANRRLSWWKSSKNSVSNQSGDQSVFGGNAVSNNDAISERDLLSQLHEERIEWLTDANCKDINGNEIYSGFYPAGEDELNNWNGTDSSESVSRCVIS
ncbi:guanine nucleotide exchange factor subunit RIC1-like isoform X2 [Symsagittifera roscoffensis]|uniref:guanine nucleotide exchange factor subunit RIC1-like isoform X2 n=1 Tax=Symsagittifera roscoffensis TaxID=84072 RepID=UPI00307C1142